MKLNDFAEQLDEWVEKHKDTVNIIWLDEEKTKCLIDVSKIFDPKNLSAVVGFTLLRRKSDFTFTAREGDSLFDCIVDVLRKAFVSTLASKERLKHLEEAYQCKSDSTVDSLGTYELLERLCNSTEVTSFDSSFQSLYLDSCEFCGHKNSSNLINLSCVHSLCLICARFAFKDQIVNHSKELVCPICESTQDIMRLTFAVPIPLIKTFIKEKFRTLMDNEVRECPRCLGQFEKVPGAHSVNCKKCCISFCQNCFKPPHFPLSCDQMKIWFFNFEEQYKLYFLEKSPRYAVCFCGNYEIWKCLDNIYGYQYCRECGAKYRYNNGVWACYNYTDVPHLKILEASEIQTHCKKSLMEFCMEIRGEINNISRMVEIRKLGKEFLGEEQVDQLINLRFKILKLIEYGTIWLHFEKRNQGSEENKEISKTLKKLRQLLTFIVIQITNKNSLKIEENFTALQDSYSKALTLF
ncbi:hypothetical protein FO519_009935 [Halicephalobus sp. NKZ332]|nr:hypothetical protein FO519_009935 [Halicephalobus sp. NKZ332]